MSLLCPFMYFFEDKYVLFGTNVFDLREKRLYNMVNKSDD